MGIMYSVRTSDNTLGLKSMKSKEQYERRSSKYEDENGGTKQVRDGVKHGRVNS